MQKMETSSQVTVLQHPLTAITFHIDADPAFVHVHEQAVASLKRKPCAPSSNLKASAEARKKPRNC